MSKVCSVCTRQLEPNAANRELLWCPQCGHTESASRIAAERRVPATNTSHTADTGERERGRRLVTGNPKPTLKALKVDFPTTTNPLSRSPAEPKQQKPSWLDPVPSLSANRVSSATYDCLYPGALFEGIQTNKTKEHRVSVRIVDINLQQSTLAGFLTIHDLTDHHPEITTFFDGQIIGDTHGFVTSDWGASEKVDTTHWQQFTPYHHIHPSELVKPRMTLKHPSISGDRGVLFMRWKERFLVPDHRVRAINGASYAGFYYICIELGSLMGALHSEALERPAPARKTTVEDAEEEDFDASNEPMDAEMSATAAYNWRTGRRSRSRRSTSRNTRTVHGLADPVALSGTPGNRIRIPGSAAAAAAGLSAHDLLEEDKPPHEYAATSPSYASSSAMPTPTTGAAPYGPSTSPVTGANRIRRASASASGARRRRLSIYSAGSVQAQMTDHHGHAHPYAHAHAHSHSHVLSPPQPSLGSTPSVGYLHSGYGRTADDGEREREDEGAEDEIMALDDALALDPIAERERENERRLDDQRRLAARERYAAAIDGTEDHALGYGHTGARKGTGWIGGGAARLTGYYYHSEKDHCDLYQKLELHHVPERTRGSFEFR